MIGSIKLGDPAKELKQDINTVELLRGQLSKRIRYIRKGYTFAGVCHSIPKKRLYVILGGSRCMRSRTPEDNKHNTPDLVAIDVLDVKKLAREKKAKRLKLEDVPGKAAPYVYRMRMWAEALGYQLLV